MIIWYSFSVDETQLWSLPPESDGHSLCIDFSVTLCTGTYITIYKTTLPQNRNRNNRRSLCFTSLFSLPLDIIIYYLLIRRRMREEGYVHTWKKLHFLYIYVNKQLYFQFCDHERVAATHSTSIKLFTHVQSAITAQVQSCQLNIKVSALFANSLRV